MTVETRSNWLKRIKIQIINGIVYYADGKVVSDEDYRLYMQSSQPGSRDDRNPGKVQMLDKKRPTRIGEVGGRVKRFSRKSGKE